MYNRVRYRHVEAPIGSILSPAFANLSMDNFEIQDFKFNFKSWLDKK